MTVKESKFLRKLTATESESATDSATPPEDVRPVKTKSNTPQGGPKSIVQTFRNPNTGKLETGTPPAVEEPERSKES